MESAQVARPGSGAPTPPATSSSPYGLHRVIVGPGERPSLPQAARVLDTRAEIWPDEVRIDVDPNVPPIIAEVIEQLRRPLPRGAGRLAVEILPIPTFGLPVVAELVAGRHPGDGEPDLGGGHDGSSSGTSACTR